MSTRDALVAAAAALLDEGGPERVTLREVGRRAGVSHNAPYKHFADKQALLAEVGAREVERLGQYVTMVADDTTPAVELLRLVLLEYARWALASPRRFELVNGLAMNVGDELRQRAEASWQQIVALAAAAQQEGDLPPGDPERLAAFARALAHGAAELQITGHLAVDGKGRANAADLVDDLFTLFRAGR